MGLCEDFDKSAYSMVAFKQRVRWWTYLCLSWDVLQGKKSNPIITVHDLHLWSYVRAGTVVDETSFVAFLQSIYRVICAHVKNVCLIAIIVDFPSSLGFVLRNEFSQILMHIVPLF